MDLGDGIDLDASIVITPRFCGPPDSGNGGYVCGLLASFISGTAEVTLRRPPPLDRRLAVTRSRDGDVLLRDGELTVAEARRVSLQLDVPAAPTVDEAENAASRYFGFVQHTFPTCFVCGPKRASRDGLRIFAGPVAGRDIVAAHWIPDASLADDAGLVRPEFVWAALDCPGAFAVTGADPLAMVLGRLTACVDTGIRPGEPCVVIGWKVGRSGRKHYAGTALFSGSGELCAKAQATWIQIDVPSELG